MNTYFTKTHKQARQGDLMFERIDTLPEGKTKKENSVVLALGEFSGHKHVLTCEKPIEYLEEDGEKYFVLKAKAVLTHGKHNGSQVIEKEHETEVFEPGTYRMWFHTEFDYFQKQQKIVQD